MTASSVSGWQFLAAEQVNGTNQVLLKDAAAGTYAIWTMNSNWNLISGQAFSISSAQTLTEESIFQIDINGDGRYSEGTVDFLTGLPDSKNSAILDYDLTYNGGPLSTSTGHSSYDVLLNWKSGDQIILKSLSTNYVLTQVTNLNGLSGTGIYQDLNHSGVLNSSDPLVGLVENTTGLALTNTSQFHFV